MISTYTRDGFTGLDYADQRYYAASYGRFNTADPYRASAGPAEPGSWNRYSYVQGDPVNYNDESGLARCSVVGVSTRFQDDVYASVSTADIQCFSKGGTAWGTVYGVPFGGDYTAAAEAEERDFGAWLDRAERAMCISTAIGAAAKAIGLDFSGFTEITVQVAGDSNGRGGTYGTTELNLSGGNVQGVIRQMCDLGFSNNGNNFCPGNANYSPLVGAPHAGYDGNFRSPGLANSVQVNTSGQLGIQVDIDPWNPADGALGALLHGLLQVLPNKIQGKDNTYGCP